MLHLLDVSGFQPVGFTPPAGTDGLWVKATEGSRFTSGEFPTQMAAARKNTALPGAYHFARPEESSGASQADRFLAVARPLPTDLLWLDLEASMLSQSVTNLWAIEFAKRIRLKAPRNKLGLYMGAGYAANGTGKGLNKFFDLWWYPQYPSVFQLNLEGEEFWRMMNRSHRTPDRIPIATSSSLWPGSYSPWLPSGLTCGWTHPHFWQFTDNHNKIDASISELTIEQVLNWGVTTTEEHRWFQGISI